MAFVAPGLRFGILLSTPLIVAAPFILHARRHPILLDSPDPFKKITNDLKNAYNQDAQNPMLKKSVSGKLRPNPSVVRQISMGSILGVLGGMGVSVFSKPLAVLLGLGVVVVQFLESRGIHVVPYSFLQKRLQSTNVRGLIQNNVALKLSFGVTFALAAFAEF